MSTSPATSKLGAIVKMKCPHCREGDLFVYPTAYYHPSKFNKMYHNCPKCNSEYSPEPGFFIGAMYVSYAFNVAILVTFFTATRILFNPQEAWVYITAILVPVFLLFPLNYRISRSIFLHLFGDLSYDPKAVSEG